MIEDDFMDVDSDEFDEEKDLSENLKGRVYELVSAPNAKRIRLDQFITRSIENASRSKVQQLIEAGGVTINGNIILKPGKLVLPGDKIVCIVPKPKPPDIIPEDIPLEIIYEDDSVLIINKPAGMVTHPAYGNYTGTLVNALLYHTNRLSMDRGVEKAGIVHRLDKETSGLICVAKTERAHAFLSKQFADRAISREYWALVWGTFPEKTGVIEAPIDRHKIDRKKMAVVEGGKQAKSEYTVLCAYENHSLIKIKLHTGRTHQIRVHLSHVHHPVFGDPTYGGRRILYGSVSNRYKAFINSLLTAMTRQALHAKTIGFVHPETRQRLFFESDLPEDMKNILGMFDEYYG